MKLSEQAGGQTNIALVLSGGGAKGAFQAGALQVLNNLDYNFDVISGVSVGSLNGAMAATNQIDELIDIWENISRRKIMKKHSLLSIARRYLTYKIGLGKPPVSRYHNKPLRKLMRRHLLNKKAMLPFHFGYVTLESGQYVQNTIQHSGDHTIERADLDKILASTAIPVYFNPVQINDSTAVDGGLRNISPIREVLPYNPDQVIIISNEPVDKDPEAAEVRDILDIAFRSIDIMLDEIFQEDIDRFLTVNRLVRQAEEEGITLTKSNGVPYKFIEPILIDPTETIGDPLDFNNERIHDLMAFGRKRAREVLGGIHAPIA